MAGRGLDDRASVPARRGDEGYTVSRIEPPHLLLLALHHRRVEWVRKEGLWPRFGNSTWAFILEPIDAGRGTRLLARLHYYLPPGIHLVYWPLFEVVDYILEPMMLRNIKRRAEASGRGRSEERRVGKECSLTCRSRWSPYH